MKKYFLLLAVLIVVPFSVWATEKHPLDLSTSELGKYIFELEKQDEKNWEKNIFLEILPFLSTNLKEKDIKYIGTLIVDTNQKIQKSSQEIHKKSELFLWVDNEKREIIVRQSVLYKELAPFVDPEKYEAFIQFVSESIPAEKTRNDMLEKIQKSRIALDKKVEHYNQKVISNKKQIKDSLQDTFQTSMKKRLKDMEKSATTSKLTAQQQIVFYNDFLMELQDMIAGLSKGNISENFQEIRRDMIVQIMDEVWEKIIALEKK